MLRTAVYFHHLHHVPLARLCEVFRDLWGISVSSVSLLRSIRFVAEQLAPITESIRVALQTEPVVNTDETARDEPPVRVSHGLGAVAHLLFAIPSGTGPH